MFPLFLSLSLNFGAKESENAELTVCGLPEPIDHIANRVIDAGDDGGHHVSRVVGGAADGVQGIRDAADDRLGSLHARVQHPHHVIQRIHRSTQISQAWSKLESLLRDWAELFTHGFYLPAEAPDGEGDADGREHKGEELAHARADLDLRLLPVPADVHDDLRVVLARHLDERALLAVVREARATRDGPAARRVLAVLHAALIGQAQHRSAHLLRVRHAHPARPASAAPP
mmetsp:Transcript_5419/g.13564  ORF Transcript_5419/g.13564 Transcript_5419/m.13564 type:complete len:230 (+) Transcript_5419:497-1186(+)